VAPGVRDARFPDEVEEAAYYVVSEGLTNVLKHAGTEQATVTLDADGEGLIVEVTDRGRGCGGGWAPGSGLVGLRDRLNSLGGELHMHGRPGGGTALRAVLPVEAADRHG